MINLNVIISPVFLNNYNIKNRNFIVIDNFRATTSIAHILNNGANSITPVNNFEFLGYSSKQKIEKVLKDKSYKEKVQIFKKNNPDYLLVGEYQADKIPEFDYGNSPYEFYNGDFTNKNIIMFTTNGTNALNLINEAKNIFLACFNNVSYVADIVGMLGEDVDILCAGNNLHPSFEDILVAGCLIQEFHEIFNFKIKLSDSGKLALSSYLNLENNLVKILRGTEHAEKLIAKGYFKDVEISSNLNSINLVPVMKDNLILKM